jgi:2-alkyl-3-oxoalkanoate reductase
VPVVSSANILSNNWSLAAIGCGASRAEPTRRWNPWASKPFKAICATRIWPWWCATAWTPSSTPPPWRASGVSWENYHSINTVATQNIVAGCLRHHVRKLVYTSSPSVTFDGSDQNGVDESVPYPSRWLCHYQHTKALAEQHVLESNGQQGLATCALRPHLIWGPRDSHLIPRLLQRARSGQLRQVGDGKNLVDMIYVENAAAAHLQAADALEKGSRVCGRAYFISQGEPVNCWGWINEILGLAGLPPVRKSISFRTAWRIGAVMESVYRALGWTSEPRMTRFLASQLAKNHYFDIRRAQNDFGYVPQISTAEGMKRLAAELASSKS